MTHSASSIRDRVRQRVEAERAEFTEPGPFDSPADVSAMLATAPPKQTFLCTDRVPLGRGIAITGVGGSSKTTLLKQLAIGAIIGRLPWGWEVEATGKAVLVLTEDTGDDIHRSLYYMARSLGLSRHEVDTVAGNLFIFPRAGQDTKILARSADGTLQRTGTFFALEEKIKAIGNVVFAGIDPALGVTDGDELSQTDQRALGKAIDDLAVNTMATVAVVTHATKGSIFRDELDGHQSRGGGAITDALRAEYALRTMTRNEAKSAGISDIEERKRHVQFLCTKANCLPPAAFVPTWLRRDETGVLREVEVFMDQQRGDEGISKAALKAFEILNTVCNGTGCATTRDWRTACVDAGIITAPTDDGRRSAILRIARQLEKFEMIRKGLGRGIWVPINDDNAGGEDDVF